MMGFFKTVTKITSGRKFTLRRCLATLLALYSLRKIFSLLVNIRNNQKAQERLKRCKDQGFHVAIIGAGASGICLGVHLKKSGIPFTIYEGNSAFGGTWLKNVYPGAACDTASHWYSFSFENNYDWDYVWAKQPQILSYFQHVALKYGLEKHTKFNVQVTGAELCRTGEREMWTVEYIENGVQMSEKHSSLISAVGQLDRPFIPTIKNINQFKGQTIHTAQWDANCDFADKNVVGIGTGPSAIQAYPEIAKHARSLVVVQRSPVWCFPKLDYKYSQLMRWIFKHFPFITRLNRLMLMAYHESLFYTLFPTSQISKGNKFTRNMIQKNIQKQLGGDKFNQIGEDLVPKYPIGCKRLALSSDWIPMFARSNVKLSTSPVANCLPNAVEFEDGKIEPCDILVYATGFQTTKFLSNLNLREKSGCSLEELWNGTPKAYKGVAISGLPNFFMVYGPGTNLGHSSVLFMIENQIEYIVSLLKIIVDEQLASMEIKEENYTNYFENLQKDLKKTVFASDSCQSWYKNEDGVIVNNWSSSCIRYYQIMRDLDIESYHQIPLSKSFVYSNL